MEWEGNGGGECNFDSLEATGRGGVWLVRRLIDTRPAGICGDVVPALPILRKGKLSRSRSSVLGHLLELQCVLSFMASQIKAMRR